MKTIFAVIGVLVVLGVIVVVGGGYWAYKNSGSKMVELIQPEIDKFVAEKKPPAEVEGALRRVVNSAKKQPPLPAIMLVGIAGGAMEDGQVSFEEMNLMNEGAQMAEQKEMTNEEGQALMERAQKVMPNLNNRKR
jgi:hypothetical protein